MPLALHPLWREPGLSALAVLVLALGIGATLSCATLLRAMAAHPAPQHEGRLYNVQLNPWPPGSPYVQPGEPPTLLTYQDVEQLMQARAAPRQVAMYAAELPVRTGSAPAQLARVRFTTADFFAMFQPPFLSGSGWHEGDESGAVLSRAASERLFGVSDGRGRRLRVGTAELRVLGVLDDWQPLPRYYDITALPFMPPEEIFVPLATGLQQEQRSGYNTNCGGVQPRGFAELLRSECVWLNFWIEVNTPAQLTRYRGFLDDYVRAQQGQGRLPQGQQRLRSIAEWLHSQGVVREDLRVLSLLSLAFLAVCAVNLMALLLARAQAALPALRVHRSLGASHARLFARGLAGAATIGLIGALLGLPVAAAGLAWSRSLYPDLAVLTQWHWGLAAAGIALALVTALLAGLWPAWCAAARLR